MNLDPQQQAAVMTDSRQVLCLAGAGSGKTRVLVERIAHLIEHEKVSPYELMAISFTRKASGELKKRLEERIGRAAHHITTGTIHAVALRYLKRFGEMIGLNARNLTVYSEWESDFLLKEVATDLGIYKGKTWKVPKREIVEMLDTYYQEGRQPEDDHPCRRVFDELVLRCYENHSLPYGFLLVEFRRLLRSISPHLHFKHIFVDEVQDLDILQHKIFKELAELCGASLFYVGDLDQSIYSWRGAVPEYLIEHQAEFQIYKIESNYRSCPEIVEAANRLIEHNESRIPRTMKATREEKGNIVHAFECDTDKVCALIQIVLNNGNKDAAVLSRNHFLLKKLASMLDVINLPYTYIGRQTELIESSLFRTFHSFLKLLVNSFDNFSFLLIREILGLSKSQYNEIRLAATQESKSHFQAWQPSECDGGFFRLYEKGAAEGNPWNLKDTILNLKSIFEAQDADMKLVTGVADFILNWAEENPMGILADYLDYLAAFDIQEEVKEEDDKLKLMTIHAAKGLEWATVILIGCNEGILPSKQSIEAEDVQGERRLMYVAMTRAKDSLILVVRPECKVDALGKVYENPESRFVREMNTKAVGEAKYNEK